MSLQAFARGLLSDGLVQPILAEHGLDRVDPAAWYPLDTVRSIYAAVQARVGRFALRTIGRAIAEARTPPPSVKDIRQVLAGIGAAYLQRVRGPDAGAIACSFEDDSTAILVYRTPFNCALGMGTILGFCSKYEAAPLIEHGADGCGDTGADACTYRVTW